MNTLLSAVTLAAASVGHAEPGVGVSADAMDHDRVGGQSADFVERAALNYTFEPEATTSRPTVRLAALQDSTDATGSAESIEPIADFGAKDSWRLNVQFQIGEDVKTEDNWEYIGGVGFSYFLEDNLSLDFEFNAAYFDQEVGDSEIGANFNLLLRWHFLPRDSWSLYIDGGAGMLLTTDDVPDDGSSFNFTPQAGLGASFDIGNNNRLMVGARWHHISNANLYDENPGRDSIVGYLAVSMPF